MLDIEKAKTIIDELIPYLEQACEELYVNECGSFSAEDGEELGFYFKQSPLVKDTFYGASKICLELNGIDDFVLKIPFSHSDDQVFYEVAGNFCMMTPDREWDYCNFEAMLYDIAKSYGIADIFAEEYYVTSVFNIPFYIQAKVTEIFENTQRCDDYYMMNNKEIKDTKDELSQSLHRENWNLDAAHINIFFLEDIYNEFGEEKTNILIDFIDKFNLSDFNTSNIGYINGVPILFDYCGFYDFNG